MTLQARAEITDVILRYGAHLDARDAERLLDCFTEDVHLEYFNGEVVIDGIDGARSFFLFGSALGVDSIVRTTHLWSVGPIEVSGDRASVTSSCVAYLFGVADDQPVLITRGLRYVDELRRDTDIWRIAARRHLPDWETRVDASSPSRGRT